MTEHVDPGQRTADQTPPVEPTPYEPREQWLTYIEREEKPARDRKDSRGR